MSNLKNKLTRLLKSKENVNLLREVHEKQNQHGKAEEIDIENSGAFKEREKKSKRKRKADEDRDGELTLEEQALLAKFDQGDKEIDSML